MVNKTSKNKMAGKKKAMPASNKRKSNVKSMKRIASKQPVRLSRYLQLLNDPCAGDISAQPPYIGIDGGYAIRTTDYITYEASGYIDATVGATTRADFVISLTPSAGGSSGLILGAAASTTVVSTANVDYASFIRNAALVRHYRPKAACLKFIPTGSANTRQGLVSRGYSTGQAIIAGNSFTAGAVVPLSQATDTISTVAHEVKWLPTAQDALWGDNNEFDNSQFNGGCVFIVGQGVDATVTSATTAAINGQFEVTVVWEWQPVYENGITTAFTTPPTDTLNSVLGRVGDIASFVLGGARRAANAVSGIANMYNMVSDNYTRGPSLLTYY